MTIHALGLFILYIPNLTCSLLYNLASLAVRELVDNDALANGIGVESLAVNCVRSDNLSRSPFCLNVLYSSLVLLQVEVPCSEAVLLIIQIYVAEALEIATVRSDCCNLVEVLLVHCSELGYSRIKVGEQLHLFCTCRTHSSLASF